MKLDLAVGRDEVFPLILQRYFPQSRHGGAGHLVTRRGIEHGAVRGALHVLALDDGDLLLLVRAYRGVGDVLAGGRLGDDEVVEDDRAAHGDRGLGYLLARGLAAGGEERAGEGGGSAEEEEAS